MFSISFITVSPLSLTLLNIFSDWTSSSWPPIYQNTQSLVYIYYLVPYAYSSVISSNLTAVALYPKVLIHLHESLMDISLSTSKSRTRLLTLLSRPPSSPVFFFNPNKCHHSGCSSKEQCSYSWLFFFFQILHSNYQNPYLNYTVYIPKTVTKIT